MDLARATALVASVTTSLGFLPPTGEAVPEVKAVRLDNPDIILTELPLLADDTDFVIADGPGSQTERTTASPAKPGAAGRRAWPRPYVPTVT